MNSLLVIASLLLALVMSSARADVSEPAPDTKLIAVTEEVLATLRDGTDRRSDGGAALAALVETKILPLFDFARMTQLAVGRNWRVASAQQQEALTREFKVLLVCTYSSVLANYRDQSVAFRPLRMAPQDTRATVKSDLTQSGAERLTIDYDLEKTPLGWKVQDIRIGGVSLVTTYRTTFAQEVRDRGIDGLIRLLTEKNDRGGARCRSGGA